MKVSIDAGAFLAISDKSDTHHKTAASVYQKIVDLIQAEFFFGCNYRKK
ncbi:MAG: hypothetical protein HY279_08020 [Nitrospinae bacterium]|nr:hypothetical protein [Nitrospinota bacterium]